MGLGNCDNAVLISIVTDQQPGNAVLDSKPEYSNNHG